MLITYRQTITNDSYRNYVFTRGQYVVRKHTVFSYLLFKGPDIQIILGKFLRLLKFVLSLSYTVK